MKYIAFLGFISIGAALGIAFVYYIIILLKKAVSDVGDIILHTTLQSWIPLPKKETVTYDVIKEAKKLLKEQNQWAFALNKHGTQLFNIMRAAAWVGLALFAIAGALMIFVNGSAAP